MPLIVTSTTGVPAAAESEPLDRVHMSITDPAGTVWHLDGSAGIWLAPGRRGFDAAPYELYKDKSPAVDGAFLRGVRADVRELFVPVWVLGGSRAELKARKRGFIAALAPWRGVCVLTEAQPDGTRRHIGCYYASGMEGEYSEATTGVTEQAFGLVLQCLDPYWFGDDVTARWGGTSAQTFFPLRHTSGNLVKLVSSQLLGATTLDVAGDVPAYPRWLVTGPASAVTLANTTTGKTLTVTVSLAGGSNWLAIDTRPGTASILSDAGTNLWTGLASGGALWPLQPGSNALSVTVTGSGASSAVQVTYQPRFEVS